jgi:calcineurin-like phosphoesterase family protein
MGRPNFPRRFHVGGQYFDHGLFFSCDQHLGHEAVRIYMERPWTTQEEHDTTIIDRAHEIVGPKGVFFLLGDVVWNRWGHFAERLPGRKVLIVGNHDDPGVKHQHHFVKVVGSNNEPGTLLIKVNEQRVVLSHCPYWSWSSSPHGVWHFHGHSHGGREEMERFLYCDVGVDVWDYYPVPWEVLEAKLKARLEAFWAWRESLEALPHDAVDERLAGIREANRRYRQQVTRGATDGQEQRGTEHPQKQAP